MKNIINLLLIIVFSTSFYSCVDESLNPHPELINVGMVESEVILPESGISLNLSSTDNLIHIKVTAPREDVDSFSLLGTIKLDGQWIDAVEMKTISSFPGEIILDADDIKDAFSSYALTHGTQFRFLGSSISNGHTINIDNAMGGGFNGDDDPDAITSGFTAAYQYSKTYYLLNP